MTVAIKEGSKSRQFGNTDYLRTKLVGGGTCDWVREDARQLTKKKVKKDGTYKASDEHDKYGNSYFAFSSFTVAVKKKSITGKRKDPEHPDDPSYDYDVEVSEDDNGELVETGLPHHIKITKNPNKLTYTDGETIEKTGMVVKAYNKDGSLWTHEGYTGGVIPLSEIKLSPSKADGDTAIVSKDGLNLLRLTATERYVAHYTSYDRVYVGTGIIGTYDGVPMAIAWDEYVATPHMYITKYQGYYYAAFYTDNPIGYYIIVKDERFDWSNVSSTSIPSPKVFTYLSLAQTPESVSRFNFSISIPESDINPYHEELFDPSGLIKNKIETSWSRYGDGKKLTDDFNISVVDSGNGAGGSW